MIDINGNYPHPSTVVQIEVVGVWRLDGFYWWWLHDDAIKWKHSPRCWPLMRGIHRYHGTAITVTGSLRGEFTDHECIPSYKEPLMWMCDVLFVIVILNRLLNKSRSASHLRHDYKIRAKQIYGTFWLALNHWALAHMGSKLVHYRLRYCFDAYLVSDHHLNQRWSIISWTIRDKPQWNPAHICAKNKSLINRLHGKYIATHHVYNRKNNRRSLWMPNSYQWLKEQWKRQ